MDWLQIIVLGLIQGVTEFLPISSSAHLVLPAQLGSWPDQGLAFDVGVHFGSLLAVLAYFRTELTSMATAVVRYPVRREYDADVDLVLKLALATLPLAVVGFAAKDVVEMHLRTVGVIATTTVLFGLLLWYADRSRGERQTIAWSDALVIGLAQVLALVPGTSRSGITISAALLMGLGRVAASRVSFLLAIPAIAGAQLLLTLDLLDAGVSQRWMELLAGAVIAGLSAYACIHYFIALVERTGMLPYVIYRLLLGTFLAGLLWMQAG